MTVKAIKATFDGEVFRPSEPVALEPNTAVVLTVEPEVKKATGEPGSFLRYLASLKLDGPIDGSENLHMYLYGEEPRSER